LIQPLFFDLIDQPASRGFLDVERARHLRPGQAIMAGQGRQH